jgi:hypothetical protein
VASRRVRPHAGTAIGALCFVAACTHDFGAFAVDEKGDEPMSADGSSGAEGGADTEAASRDSATEDSSIADVGPDHPDAKDASDAGADGGADYTVGGTITGLSGSGLQLSNSITTLNVPSPTTVFSFPPQPDLSTYAVSVTSEPMSPAQTCIVTNGTGTVMGADVMAVHVACTTTSACAPMCTDGAPCGANTDCGSHVCSGGTCQPPACAPTCSNGRACGSNSDCSSHHCSGSRCH